MDIDLPQTRGLMERQSQTGHFSILSANSRRQISSRHECPTLFRIPILRADFVAITLQELHDNLLMGVGASDGPGIH